MISINRTENFIVRVPDQDLYVIPVYHFGKNDPNFTEFLKYLPKAEDRSRASSEHSVGDREEFVLDDGSNALLVYLDETDKQTVLSSVLNEIFEYLLDHPEFKEIAIGQLALIEFGYPEESAWANYQSEKMIVFLKKNKGLNLTLVVPIDDSRPLSGEHLSDGILPESREGQDDYADLPMDEAHHAIAVPLKKVGSYADYFRLYISIRENQLFQIRINEGESFDGGGIHSLRDLQRNLAYYEGRGGKNENFSKWNKPVKDKATGELYYPVPSKQKLKLIACVLDMSYQETLECLHFFGYGLAHFSKEDQAFAYILKDSQHWTKPLDIVAVNNTLKKRFGKRAALYVDHGKGSKKEKKQ